jgi:hypothetical protein
MFKRERERENKCDGFCEGRMEIVFLKQKQRFVVETKKKFLEKKSVMTLTSPLGPGL